MTRSAARRSSAVQADKSPPPAPPVPDPRPDEAPAPETGAGVRWYWRLVMFLWITSFAGLLLYEWLAGILKTW